MGCEQKVTLSEDYKFQVVFNVETSNVVWSDRDDIRGMAEIHLQGA